MSNDSCTIPPTPIRGPMVFDAETGETGNSSTVRLDPGQLLPPHRNASKVVLTVVRGDGVITVEGVGDRELREGAFVQLDANAMHSVVAGDTGLELLVAIMPNCCSTC